MSINNIDTASESSHQDWTDNGKEVALQYQIKNALDISKFQKVLALFAILYQEFEKSGYNTLLLVEIQRIIHKNEEVKVIGGRLEYHWRMFLEYALQNLPLEATLIRELLMERVRHAWEQQRMSEKQGQSIRQIEKLGKVLENNIQHVLYDLNKRGIIADINDEYEDSDSHTVELSESEHERLEDGTVKVIEGSIDGSYLFGSVSTRILTWTDSNEQLAKIICYSLKTLKWDNFSTYEVMGKIRKSGKINIDKKEWPSVHDKLDVVRQSMIDIPTDENINRAVRLLVTLLQG